MSNDEKPIAITIITDDKGKIIYINKEYFASPTRYLSEEVLKSLQEEE